MNLNLNMKLINMNITRLLLEHFRVMQIRNQQQREKAIQPKKMEQLLLIQKKIIHNFRQNLHLQIVIQLQVIVDYLHKI